MSAASAFPISLQHRLLAPTRPPLPKAPTPQPSIPRPTSAQLTQAAAVIMKSGWLEMLEPLMPHALRKARGKHPGGRKPDMTLNALLTGFLLLAIMERPILVRDVYRLLAFGLDAGSKKHLGLNPKRPITERMVSKHFSLVAGCLNPSRYTESNAPLFDKEQLKEILELDASAEITDEGHERIIETLLEENEKRLEDFIRVGLRATHPANSPHDGDYAIDGSYIHSWEAAKSTRRRTTYVDANGISHKRTPNPAEMSDPDAAWWSKKTGKSTRRARFGDKSDVGLGYLITAVTQVKKDLGPNIPSPDMPHLIEHLSVQSASIIGHAEGSRVIKSMIAYHEAEDEKAGVIDRTRGDILADREYANTVDWLKSMHELGLTPHFLLHKDQLGHTKTLASGVIIVDGIPYSPGMPDALRHSNPPPLFANRSDRAQVAAFNMQRKPYRIRVNGGARQDDGSLKLYCPASNLAKSAISCANKPASKRGPSTRIQIGSAMPVIMNSPMPAICSQSSVTISFDENPYWQPYIPGTAEHQWSVNRRNLIESAFSRIKDEATQSLRRGTFRVMGRAKVSLAVLFNTMAANLVEVARWEMRASGLISLDAAREKKVRTPRRHTKARQAAKTLRDEARRLRVAKTLLEENGLLIDYQTGEILESDDPPNT